MHLLIECQRTLAPGGRLLLTTPNAASLSGVAAILHGWRNPQVFSRYPKAGNNDTPHVREYTPKDLAGAVEAAGFEVEALFTARMAGCDNCGWVGDLLEREGFDTQLRGEQIYCVVRKRDGGFTIDRYPSFLYAE